MNRIIKWISIIFVICVWLLFLNFHTLSISKEQNIAKISSQKNALDFYNITGTYSLNPEKSVLTLGYNYSGNKWGSGKVSYILNGYPFIYTPNNTPMKVYLIFNVVSPLHSNIKGSDTIVTINNHKIIIPLSEEKSGAKIHTYLPSSKYLDEFNNLKIEIPREYIERGKVTVSLYVPNKTGIDFGMVKLVAELPKNPDYVKIGKVVVFLSILLVIYTGIFILIKKVLKNENTEFKDILVVFLTFGIIISSISGDIWDFVRWQNLAYYAFLFNSKNVASWWADNPLWPYMIAVFSSPYFLLWKVFPNHTSQIILAFFIKLPIVVSYICSAIIIKKILADMLKLEQSKVKFSLYLWLANPYVIWQLMWGQRDLIAVALAMAGIYAILKNRVFLGGLLLAIGACVKSYIFLWLPIPFLMFLYRKDLKNMLIYLLSLTIYPITWLLLPYDLLKNVFLYRSGSENILRPQGITWMFSLYRFGFDANYFKWLFPLGIILGWSVIAFKMYKKKNIDNVEIFRHLIFISTIFYLTYYNINPQFLLLTLPLLIIIASELAIIYSIFGILYLYSHFQDYHAFLSPLVKNYPCHFLCGSTIDIALSFTFSVFLIAFIIDYLLDGKLDKNIKMETNPLKFASFVGVFILPYAITRGHPVGLITITFILIGIILWMFLLKHAYSSSKNVSRLKLNKIQLISSVLCTTLLVILGFLSIGYLEIIIIPLLLILILMNLLSIINNIWFSPFIPLVNIFFVITYLFKSSPGYIFMKLIRPPYLVEIFGLITILISLVWWIWNIINYSKKY